MYRAGAEEEDGCIVEWRKMETRRQRRMEGKEGSGGVMDGWGGVGEGGGEGWKKA